MAEHPLHLLVESLDTVWQKANQAKVLPLFLTECGALIQVWVIQYINATQRFGAERLLLLHAKQLRHIVCQLSYSLLVPVHQALTRRIRWSRSTDEISNLRIFDLAKCEFPA